MFHVQGKQVSQGYSREVGATVAPVRNRLRDGIAPKLKRLTLEASRAARVTRPETRGIAVTRRVMLAALLLLGVDGPVRAGSSDEAAFTAANATAMDRMMKDMTVRPSGDVDKDFVEMMVPHHQGAIDMAQAELRYGRNETLRRIAQEIVVQQQQEIAAMHLALGQALPPSVASPDQPPMTMPMNKDHPHAP